MRISQNLPLHPLPQYILSRGILLTCAMVASALVALVWAGGYSLSHAALYAYAEGILTTAPVVLAAGLFGSLLLEDILIKRGL